MSKGLVGYELAVAAMAGIEANPEHWKQRTWACGTGGCLAGWAIAINGELNIAALSHALARTYYRDPSRTAGILLFGDTDQGLGHWVEIAESGDVQSLFGRFNSKATLYKLLALKYDVLEEVFRKDVQAVVEAKTVKDPWDGN